MGKKAGENGQNIEWRRFFLQVCSKGEQMGQSLDRPGMIFLQLGNILAHLCSDGNEKQRDDFMMQGKKWGSCRNTLPEQLEGVGSSGPLGFWP